MTSRDDRRAGRAARAVTNGAPDPPLDQSLAGVDQSPEAATAWNAVGSGVVVSG